ncbi:hypothetical protein HWV62_10387 [Athelia sp. TMB]|nr:hypothetical protein HWV62_10387 [Athelia sp. TMB]
MSDTKTIPEHEIVAVQHNQQDLRRQCYDVRINVFVHEQGFPLDVELDQYDESPTTAHFLLRLLPSLAPIGTIRATTAKDGSYYKLSRLVVIKEYRQFKFGRELVTALHRWAKAEAARAGLDHATIITHSQMYVKGFYAK